MIEKIIYICTACKYSFDVVKGDDKYGIPPGVIPSNISDDWCCPICGNGAELFMPEESYKDSFGM